MPLSFSPWFFVSRSIGLFLIVVPVLMNILDPQLMQGSDFIMDFYTAGHLASQGRYAELYPDAGATTLVTTSFNAVAHQLLPALRPDLIAIYMYSPATASLFAPLSALPPQAAAIVWQIVSILALVLSAWFVSAVTGTRTSELFWMSTLFLPVIHTLAIGQLGIVLGLLPLSAGFYLLARKRHFYAGLIWSLLVLKPQYLPAVLLVAGALFLSRRPMCILGVVSGLVATSLASDIFLAPGLLPAWFHSFRLYDTIFSNPAYQSRGYLITSLSGVLIQATSLHMRPLVKIASYAIAFFIGLYSLIASARIIRRHGNSYGSVLPLVFIIGLYMLPVILPYFRAYDLCAFALAGMLVFGNMPGFRRVRQDCLIYFLIVNGYEILWALINKHWAQPLVLALVSLVFFARILVFSRQAAVAADMEDAKATWQSGN